MREGNLVGEFRKKKKTYKFPSKNEYMYEVSSKSENGKMVKFRGEISGGISQGRGGNLGGNFGEKKIKTYKMGLRNKRTHEISSKSNKGKVNKYTGKIFWGKISNGGGKSGGRI